MYLLFFLQSVDSFSIFVLKVTSTITVVLTGISIYWVDMEGFFLNGKVAIPVIFKVAFFLKLYCVCNFLHVVNIHRFSLSVVNVTL